MVDLLQLADPAADSAEAPVLVPAGAPIVAAFSTQMLAASVNAANFLRAISSENRLMILCALIEGSKTVTEICVAVGARQSLVSQHLARLRANGLVQVERQGQFAHYSVEDPLVREIVGALHRRFCPSIAGTTFS